ncbi:MAG: LON peptidase substrate-binding domain-containing protein, partial [Candidatus Brocadiaceae bacterium]
MAQETEPTVELPAVALRKMVMFPGIITVLRIGRPRSVAALEQAREGDGRLVLIAQRDAELDQPAPADLYEVGVICKVLQTVKEGAGGVYSALVEGLRCCRVREYLRQAPSLGVRIEPFPRAESAVPPDLRRSVERLFAATAGDSTALTRLQSLSDSVASDRAIAFSLELPVAEKQLLLEEQDAEQRYRMLVPLLEREKAITAEGQRIRRDRRYEVSQEDRRRYLEERKEEIEQRLAEMSDSVEGLDEIRERIERADLPPEVREEAERELAQLGRMPPGAPQYGVAMDYLEWLCEVPWNRSTEAEVDLNRAREVLDRDHYDREEVKERILEYLSVRRLRPKSEGALLCFVGAPGVGKTSLGRSIAQATGRRFHRVSLGGVRDEAEIRGHRRTYVGALPGRMIRALCSVGVNNPVLMLDELDKLQHGLRGDPVSALLEVLDPEQNRSFVDSYLAVPCDLSRVMFIGTANTTDTIPPALLDRLEVMELSGYSTDEKVAIARQHLVRKQLEATGLADARVEIDDEALELLVEGYTREAGVRSLERQIAALCRKLAREFVGGRTCCDHLDEDRV